MEKRANFALVERSRGAGISFGFISTVITHSHCGKEQQLVV